MSDPQNLVDRTLFTFVLNHEIHRATRLQYPVSLLCLTPDLTRGAVNPFLLSRLARQAVSQLRATDLVTKLDGQKVALLLADAETRNLPVILKRVKEGLDLISPEKQPSKMSLTLSAGGSCYPQTASNAGELLRQAVKLTGRAKAEGGNRLCLPP